MNRSYRVLVTRAVSGASVLAEHLRALGMEPLLVPAIETVEPTSFAPLDAGLQQLHSFQWLLFTSATAVEAFRERMQKRVGLILPKHVRVAAIGPATARALEQLGVRANLVPAQAVAEDLLEALMPYARQPDGTAARFLLVRAQEARDVLPDGLREAGADVTIASAYRTVVPDGSPELLRRILTDPRGLPDAITFTSSSTARNLQTLCDSAEVRLPETALRVSIGPITSQTLRELQMPPHAEAREANVASLAEEVFRQLQALHS